MPQNPTVLKRNPFIGAFLRLVGLPLFGIEHQEMGFDVLGKTPSYIPYADIADLTLVKRSYGINIINIPLKNGTQTRIAGLKRKDATQFSALVNNEFYQLIAKQFEQAWPQIQSLYEKIILLDSPQHYPAACLVSPLALKTEEILQTLPRIAPKGILTSAQEETLSVLVLFSKNLHQKREAAMDAFVKNELARMEVFFNTIESNPLTPEQRLAVITDEDATLVLAGAGSGKTSVIVAKAAYLIERHIRQPNEVLLMAFGRDAATEMAERIEERSGVTVDALTFHALGNRIIREVEGKGAALAEHASDEAKSRMLIRDILINDVAKQTHAGKLLLEWFSSFYWPYKSEWDFKTKDEYYQWVEAHELRSLNGDRVKSYEEWEISNWLYSNGIEFEYEPIYEHELPADARGVYRPDFKLTESGIYIEHFGVRRSRNSDGSFRLTTAPHIDREKYLNDMDWKRKLHQDKGTILVETYSYEQVDGCLLTALREKLAPYTNLKPVPQNQIFDTLAEMGLIDSFTQTLITFLRHFKSSQSSIAQCRNRAQDFDDVPRSHAFLTIFDPFLEFYQKRLNGQIDFEDMIIRATEHVEAGRYVSPYRHLLVDEFQDISEGRARLLRALKAQHADARIFAVGDDWQSIFRFAGADIHLMRNFGKEFGGQLLNDNAIHATIDLGRTFRSVDKIALPARHFVLKNPSQIEKKVISASTAEAPSIKIMYSDRGQEDYALKSALMQIGKLSNSAKNTSVLLLGRYSFLRPSNLKILAAEFPHLSLRFMTAHGSKGLEADHVIILRVISDRMGLPSEIVDDPLLNLVLPQSETFDHAEERRLFYVALTRARKSVLIVADKEKPSIFVRELVSQPEYETMEINEPQIASRHCGACGGRLLAKLGKGDKIYYACEHQLLCGERLPSCNACDNGLPSISATNPEISTCSCGAEFPTCPECAEGWLIERLGKYGKFLGCVKFPHCRYTQQSPTGEGHNT